MGFGVWGSGFGVWGSGCRVWSFIDGLDEALGLVGFRMVGFGFRVSGFGFRV